MKVALNLLQETQKIRNRIKKIGILLQTISVGILIGFGVVVLIIFSYSFYLSSKADGIYEDIKQEKNSIEKMRPLETKHVLIQTKLTKISQAMDEHLMKQERAIEFYNFIRNRALIKAVALTENSNQLKLNFQTENVLSLVNLLVDLVNFSLQNETIKVETNLVSFNQEGFFDVDLIITLENIDGN